MLKRYCPCCDDYYIVEDKEIEDSLLSLSEQSDEKATFSAVLTNCCNKVIKFHLQTIEGKTASGSESLYIDNPNDAEKANFRTAKYLPPFDI